LGTSGPVKENTFDLTVDTIQKNRETIKKICEIASRLNKELIIKLHPSPDEYDPVKLGKEISPNIKVLKSGDIFNLIQSCKVFIVIDVSTAILDAQILGKPVISVRVKDSGYGIPSVLKTNSCLITNIDNIEETLTRIFNDKKIL